MKLENGLAGRTDDCKKLGKEGRVQLRADRQRWADEKSKKGERALSCSQVKDAFTNFRQLRSAPS